MTLWRVFALFWIGPPGCLAWHFPVHTLITHNALVSLPQSMRRQWDAVSERLEREFCLAPDRIQAAREPEFTILSAYCVKPDGKSIHNITWEPEDDLRSLQFSLNGIVESLRSGRVEASARHAGVLAHFLEDSTCPAHALIPADSPLASLRLKFAPPEMGEIALHPAIERSIPSFALDGRTPRRAGSSIDQAAESLLSLCYRIVRENREQLETLVKAFYAGDTPTVDAIRLQSARRGAELVADAYYTAFVLAGDKAH